MKLRPAISDDCPALARIQVDSYRTAYASLLPATYLAGFSYEEQEREWRDLLSMDTRSAVVVAEIAPGLLAGYVLVRMEKGPDERFDGEVAALHIRQEFQRRGIGKQLMTEAARWIYNQGGKSLFLTVLAGNPARRFYEKLGGKLQPEINRFKIDDFEAVEAIYGWENIECLL